MTERKLIVAYPPVDFRVPFSALKPWDIHIHFHYTNVIGAGACKANCAHCNFRNRPTYHIPIDHALRITQDLQREGYKIGMVSADSFSDESLIAGIAGSAFRLQQTGLVARTSGMTLMGQDYMERLDRAWEIGYRSIVITGHDVAGIQTPIQGVTRWPQILYAFRQIAAWNALHLPRSFKRVVTFTIRQDTCTLAAVRQMVAWGVAEKLDLVRFNCFANFRQLPEHAEFELSRDDIIRFFGILRQVHEEYLASPMQLGISEDWGDAGIEQLLPYLSDEWRERESGWCRAGYRLFSMNEVDGKIVLTGCVKKWDPILGHVIRRMGHWDIEWNVERIEALRQIVRTGTMYACWGGVGCHRPVSAGFGTDPAVEAAIPLTRPTS